MKRKQLSDEDRAQMVERVNALKAMLGSWDDVQRAVDIAVGPRPEEKPTKEALRLASKGQGGTGVASAVARAAAQLLPAGPRATGEQLAPTRTVTPDTGQARTGGADAWQALADASAEFGAFSDGRIAEDGASARVGLNYAARTLPRLDHGQALTMAEMMRLYRRGMRIAAGLDEEADDRPAPKVREPATVAVNAPAYDPEAETAFQRMKREAREAAAAKPDATLRPADRVKLGKAAKKR